MPGCKEEGGAGVPGWREEVDAAGSKEEGDVGAPGSEKKGDAGATGEACNFGSGCGEEGVLAPRCDEDEASTCVEAKPSVRGHACVAVERDCKFVRDEEEDNFETGCFEGGDMTGAGEGCWSSSSVWLEGGD